MPLALCSMISLVASCSGDMFLLYYKQKLSYLLETATEEKVKDTKKYDREQVNFLIDTLSFIISEGQYLYLFFLQRLMTPTYGVSTILKRNKQPLAASIWGRNLTLSLLLHLFSKNKMLHLLCSQAPLIPPKIPPRSQWLVSMSNIVGLSMHAQHPGTLSTFWVFWC